MATKTRPAPAPQLAPAPAVITIHDVETVLGSKVGAIVLGVGGPHGVALPYAGQEPLWTRADVHAWFVRSGQSITRTAEALTADLAWLNAEVAA